MKSGLYENLAFLYGSDRASDLLIRIQALLDQYSAYIPSSKSTNLNQEEVPVTEKDAVLITYGDIVQDPEKPHLPTLFSFLEQFVYGLVNTVHILPFYPYSSDDGFSVIDFRAVNPDLGRWVDVERLGSRFRLMFDAVLNHISAESPWFQSYLDEDPNFEDYFIEVLKGADLSTVFRPRALPLTTSVERTSGATLVWTTFSADQIDLNYDNPEVLYEMLETLLCYVSKGADFIRLDAVAYLWKEPGTSSINLPQTHAIIQIMRSVLDEIAPFVTLITETNLPHKQNVSYFGNGYNEAQMVYNFSLPPLVIDAFHRGDAAKLSSWASDLETPSSRTTWFNFLASHDGIGLMPAMGILDKQEISDMARRVEASGGMVSYRSNADGSKSPYELNVNFMDALVDPEDELRDQELIIRRFWASQAIMLCLKGIPGIYFHSLFGSSGWKEGVEITGRARSINRQKLVYSELQSELSDKSSFRWRVYEGLKSMLQARKECAPFHPAGGQSIVNIDRSIFACLRISRDESELMLGLHNVSNRSIPIKVRYQDMPANLPDQGRDLIQNIQVSMNDLRDGSFVIQPYDVRWITWQV